MNEEVSIPAQLAILRRSLYDTQQELAKTLIERAEMHEQWLELATMDMDSAHDQHMRKKAEEELAKVKAQLQAIEEVKTGQIKIEDTESVHLESPTYCAFCGRIFPEAIEATEQIRAHLLKCPKHPLGIELTEVKVQRDRLAGTVSRVRSAFGGASGAVANGSFENGIISLCCEALAELEKEKR